MKISALLKLNRQSVTNLATVIANANIPGFKAKTKNVIEALAQHEGLSSEAFLVELDKLHTKTPAAIKSIEKEAVFAEANEKLQLCSISISVRVVGFWSEMVQAHQASLETLDDNETFTLKDVTPSLASGGRDREELQSDAQAAENLFEAHKHVLELCRTINGKTVTKDDLDKAGWNTIIYKSQNSA